MCFVTVCSVVAGRPCVLLLSVWWWLESHVFCYCLFGGGWKAKWYGEEKCFFCLVLFGSAKDSAQETQSNLTPCLRLSNGEVRKHPGKEGGGWSQEGAGLSERVGSQPAGGKKAAEGAEAAEEEKQKADAAEAGKQKKTRGRLLRRRKSRPCVFSFWWWLESHVFVSVWWWLDSDVHI